MRYVDGMTIVRLLARPMLAAIFVVEGFKSMKDPDRLAPSAAGLRDRLLPTVKQAVPKQLADRIPEDARTLVRINGGIQAIAGLGLATGRMPRLSAALVAGTLLPTTLAGHSFWDEDDPAQRTGQRIHFLKNVGLTGGLLLAAVDTEGRPGLWWRTQHTATHARRATRHAARHTQQASRGVGREARREARAATKRAKGRAKDQARMVKSRADP